jgi:hypothetical protein
MELAAKCNNETSMIPKLSSKRTGMINAASIAVTPLHQRPSVAAYQRRIRLARIRLSQDTGPCGTSTAKRGFFALEYGGM